MATLNLEELALKSIAQQAEVSIRLASIENALIEINRRSEKRDDQMTAMMQQIIRLEHRVERDIRDRETTDARVLDLENKVDSLTENVNRILHALENHATKCTEHISGHCDDCDSTERIDVLESTTDRLVRAVDDLVEKVRALSDNKDLNEVQTLITSRYGMNWLRFHVSTWGMVWLAVVTAMVLLAIWSHYEQVKALYHWATFSNG